MDAAQDAGRETDHGLALREHVAMRLVFASEPEFAHGNGTETGRGHDADTMLGGAVELFAADGGLDSRRVEQAAERGGKDVDVFEHIGVALHAVGEFVVEGDGRKLGKLAGAVDGAEEANELSFND